MPSQGDDAAGRLATPANSCRWTRPFLCTRNSLLHETSACGSVRWGVHCRRVREGWLRGGRPPLNGAICGNGLRVFHLLTLFCFIWMILFGPGQRIGEADLPGPVALCLNELLDFSPALGHITDTASASETGVAYSSLDAPFGDPWAELEQFEMEQENAMDSPNLPVVVGGAACGAPRVISLAELVPERTETEDVRLTTAFERWHAMLLGRAMEASADAVHAPVSGGLQGSFDSARLAVVSFAQRARRLPDVVSDAGDSGDEGANNAEKDKTKVPTTDLKHAARQVEAAVRQAFSKGRHPTESDVEMITDKLQFVVDVANEGRRFHAERVQCGHCLTAWTIKDVCMCDGCHSHLPASSPMHGCRMCNFDLCGPCYRKRVHGDRSVGVACCEDSQCASAEAARAWAEWMCPGAIRSRRRRRKRGSGASKKVDSVSIFYANVTSMSKKAEHYMLNLQDCIWLAGESHLLQAEISVRYRRWRGHWDVSAAPATQSQTSTRGTYGGVIAAGKRHLATSHIAGDVLHKGWYQSPERDLVGRTLHLQGSDVLVLGGYARDGEHQPLAEAVARISRNGSLPFIWLADFNTPPEELQRAGWLEKLKARIMKPDAEITCHAGHGSLIDYAIVSCCLAPYVEECTSETCVPWGPHDGVRLRMRRSPRAVMVRSLHRPQSLAKATQANDRTEPVTLSWHDAWSSADSSIDATWENESAIAKSLRSAAEALGIGETSHKLGRELAAWARATELQALSRHGLRPGHGARPFLGRANIPRFSMKPLMGPPRLVGEHLRIPGGYGVVARLWATCRALAAKLRTAMAQGARTSEVNRMKARIVRLRLNQSSGLRCAWDIGDKADAPAGLFAILASCSPNATRSSVDASIRTFERLESADVRRSWEKSSADWHRWVAQAISKGASQAHRWTNRPNAVETLVVAPGAQGPLDVAQHHTSAWQATWQAGDSDKVATALAAVRDLRRRALAHPSHSSTATRFRPEKLRSVARSFRKGTSIGADAIAFQDVIEASDESLEELCRLMRVVVDELAVPLQVLLTVVGLLGKKLGGTRCIAVCCTFYRLLMAMIKEDVREWDGEVGFEGDSSLLGRSSIDEVAWRHLRMETAVLLGKAVGMLLWDVAKSFDSLDVPLLIERAEELNFPLDQLTLGLQVHRAPRALRAEGCFGLPIASTGVSILAGCTLSTSISRAYLQGPVSTCSRTDEHDTRTSHRVNQHVDDLSQVVIGDSEDAVFERCRKEGLRMSVALTKSKLRISTKSVASASSRALAVRIARGLSAAGQPISAEVAPDDLGITTGCGSRRAVGALKKRIQRGLARGRNVQILSRANARASRLYQTGVRPQQSYGATVCGAAPSQVRDMRRAAVLCVAPAGVQPCTATILAWRLKPRCDPAIATPLAQVEQWMKLWKRASGDERTDLRRAWARALPRTLLKGIHWSTVSGPMQATVAVLGQAGWHPVSPDKWISRTHTEYAELDWSPFANTGILEALAQDFESSVWLAAEAHFLGRGLGRGVPNLAPALAARKWLLKRERWKEAKALDVVVCGGVWDSFRTKEHGRCPVCGAEPYTAYHRYWSCPALHEHPDEAVTGTQWLSKFFGADLSHLECLWGRGILPSQLSVAAKALTPDSIESRATPGFHDQLGSQGRAFTDGSGGPRWVPAAARQTGSAVATLSVRRSHQRESVEGIGLLVAPSPGKPTVPRAELWAAIMAARATPMHGTLSLRIDASYVVTGMRDSGCHQARTKGSNGDLWCVLFDTIQSRQLCVEPVKVKAHAESQVLLGQVDVEDYAGNLLADAGAGVIAEDAVETVAAHDVSLWETRAFLTAKRLAVIEASLWGDGPRMVPAPAPLRTVEVPTLQSAHTKIQREIAATGHRLLLQGDFVRCSRCRRRRSSANLEFWTKNGCEQGRTRGPASEVGRPDEMPPVSEQALVTPAKRRQLKREQLAEQRRVAEATAAIHAEAWQGVKRALPSLAAPEPRCRLQYLDGRSVHPSHTCFECGGYLGCIKCGSVVSTSQRCALVEPCRGECPAGSRGPIRRLTSGRLPRGRSWPSGEAEPQPKRWRAG